MYGLETQNKFQSGSSNISPSTELPLRKKKARNWKTDFIVLAIANVFTIILPILLLYTAPLLGLAFMLELGILQAIGVGVAVLNIIALSLYLLKRRPRIKLAIFGCIIIILSAFYVSAFATTFYLGTKQNNEFYTPSTKNDALSLINSCQVTKIFRKDQVILFTKHDPNSQNPNDYQRYANDSDFNDLKQAAEAASSKCGAIEIVDLPAIDVKSLSISLWLKQLIC